GATTPSRTADVAQAQRFLHRVALVALEGNALADDPAHGGTARVPLPIPAANYLVQLRDQRFTTSTEMLAALARRAGCPAALSRMKRAVPLSLCAVPIILTLVLWLGVHVYAGRFDSPREDAPRPELAELSACLTRLAALERAGVPRTNIQHHALEVYLAGQY